MLNKQLMILAILLVSLLAVSAVSASDNATIDIASTDETTDEVVSVDDNQAILKEKNNVRTFTDLTDEEFICENNDVLQVNGSTMGDVPIDPSIDFDASDIIVGETLEIKVFLPSDATGNVTVIMHNETYLSDVNDGLAVVLIDGLPRGGNQNFAIYYSGDEKYLSSYVSSSIDVFGIEDYEITASSPTITFGETARVVVNVPCDAKGIVALSTHPDFVTITYESPVVNGTATFEISGFTLPNIYGFIAALTKDPKYQYKEVEGKITVKPLEKNTIIEAPDVSLAYKDPNGELIATIVDDEGNPLAVNLNVDFNGKTYSANTDSNGRAGIAIGTLSPGTYTATISYKGNEIYKASNTTSKVTVTKADTIISAMDVSLAYKDPNGELVATIINEHGKPLVVTLNVNFNGESYSVRTDSNGRASISIGTLTPGKYTATISYKGSGNYKASSTTAKVTVTKSNTIISAPDVSVAYKDPNGALVATIINEHGKPLVVNLNVDLNGKTYTARTDSNGQARIAIGTLSPGKYAATISYKGSSNYKASTTTAKVTVTKADTIISAPNVKIAYKDPSGELVATIVSEHGKPLVVNLNVNINGKDYTVRTDSNGQARIAVDTLTPGTYTATISYKGSGNYKASSTTAKVTVTKAATIISAPDVTVAYKDPNGKLVSTITNEHGKPLVVNLNVDLNGKTYTARTDSNGRISVSTAGLAPGTYTASISYKGSSNYKASSTKANIQVN